MNIYTAPLDDNAEWYVVRCKQFNEWRAAAGLDMLLGLATYVPEVRRRFRGQLQHTPFFPGYIFTRANLGLVSLSQINAVPGVIHVVAFGGRPQPVSAVVVEELRHRVDDLNASGSLLSHGFERGDLVRIRRGPLQGLEALFIGPVKPCERVHVLLDFLGGEREVEIGVDALERSESRRAPALERRTRGRGRRIKQRSVTQP
jgi:transcription antitermination factor NusG